MSNPTGSGPLNVCQSQVWLSKSRFLAGLQCHKRLYLELYSPDSAGPLDQATQARFAVGTAVGELARQRFAGGRLLTEDHQRHNEAVVHTRELLLDRSVGALYEAAFVHDDVAVRADILVRRQGGGFDLIEVKATTSVKNVHLFDLAVQLYVLKGAGMRIERACLMHLNGGYVYPGGAYNLQQLFTCADLTEQVHALQQNVAVALSAMRQSLRGDGPPPIASGPQCTNPYVCPYYDLC